MSKVSMIEVGMSESEVEFEDTTQKSASASFFLLANVYHAGPTKAQVHWSSFVEDTTRQSLTATPLRPARVLSRDVGNLLVSHIASVLWDL